MRHIIIGCLFLVLLATAMPVLAHEVDDGLPAPVSEELQQQTRA
jgi:hypothetical protein